MLIKKVRLENFKKFRLPLEREFGLGINIVKGPLNETGKSTLLEGILIALFENPKSSKAKLDSLWTWGAESKGRLHMEFQAGGDDYAINKDFNKKTLCLTIEDGQKRWDVPRQVEEKLIRLLGTASRDLFLTTCCIRQDEVRAIQSGSREVGQSMERIITGGSEESTAAEAVKKLESAAAKLRVGLASPAKYLGQIAQLQSKVGDLEKRLDDAREKIDDIEKLRLALPDVEEQLARVVQELDTCQKLVEKNKERIKIEGEIERLKKEYEQVDSLISAIDSVERERQEVILKLQELPSFDDAQKISKAKESLLSLARELQNTERDLLKRRQELTEIEGRLRRRGHLTSLASKSMLISGAIIAVVGIALVVLYKIAAIAGGLGVVLVIVSLVAKNSITAIERDKKNLQTRISDMEERQAKIDEEEAQILLEMKCTSRDESYEKCNRFEALVEKRRDYDTRHTTLLQGQTYEQLKKQRGDHIRDLATEQQKLTEDLKSTRLSPEEFMKYQQRAQELDSQKKTLERRKLEIEVGIKQAACDPEILSQLEEELQNLRENLENEQVKLRIYELAKDFISKARGETLLAIHDELQDKIERYFSTFTDGKYKKLKLEKGTPECSVYSEEKGDWVAPKELSGGTIDQFYLSYRLALVQLIYRDRLPPLILDDPFSNFDSVRLSRTLASLKKISKDQQVIIFTLEDKYDTIADRVITLP
ncbi:AAA family ATPase [Chloroflexota bacterium]